MKNTTKFRWWAAGKLIRKEERAVLSGISRSMSEHAAIACLKDKTDCRVCQYQTESCRQDAIDLAVKALEEKGESNDD